MTTEILLGITRRKIIAGRQSHQASGASKRLRGRAHFAVDPHEAAQSVPGSAFGNPGRVRVSHSGVREAVIDGVRRLDTVLRVL
ncbi:hypothetical protein ACQP1W_27315 [Spirillospora sp. CA-255316]